MEELLQQQSGSRGADLAVQSFSSLLTTQQPSPFLTLLSSTSAASAGNLQKNSAQTNLHFYDSRLQYNDYEGDYTQGDNLLFFEYDHNEDLSLVGKLTDRQGEVMRSIAGITIENQLFLQMRICSLVKLVNLMNQVVVVVVVKLVVASVRQHS